MADVDLYFRVVELDSTTEGKDPSLLWWIRHALARSDRWMPAPLVPGDTGPSPAPTVYIETFATAPEDQESVALAAGDLVRAGEAALDASGEVLRSMDGVRVLIVWRWSGAAPSLLLREGGLLREAVAEHEPLLRAEAREAHVFTSL